MKPKAIVYTSNTGFTKEYAFLLHQKIQLPVYSLNEAKTQLSKNDEIIYLGWLMAGKIQGYQKAAQRYTICGVCGVGMGSCGSQMDDVRKVNQLANDLPLFTLQGGFDMNKLSGIYKLMMVTMKNTLGKKLQEKSDKTEDEEVMLKMLLEGGNGVKEENLSCILEWYNKS